MNLNEAKNEKSLLMVDNTSSFRALSPSSWRGYGREVKPHINIAYAELSALLFLCEQNHFNPELVPDIYDTYHVLKIKCFVGMKQNNHFFTCFFGIKNR